MRKKQLWLAALAAALLLLSPGCADSANSIKETEKPPAVTEATEETRGEAPGADSLDSLRQTVAGSSRLFAAACFGYQGTADESLEEIAPQLCDQWPFLPEIPEDRIIGDGGELYCIVPLDADATVAVSKGYWDEENGQYIYDDMLYSSPSGEPILIYCNGEGWAPDTQVYICGPSGEAFWCPERDINGCLQPPAREELLWDISPYRELLMAEHRDLKENQWVLPTHDQLMGTAWSWCSYLEDGRELRCQMSIDKDFLSVRWNDGIDREDHVYQDAVWALSYGEGTAVLSIDFREMAGVLRYNVLYHEEYDQLYVSVDVLQQDMPLGWEPLSRFMANASVPEPAGLVGTWELGWTEVEADIRGAEPGSQIIEITEDGLGQYRISYINRENPGWSYYDKELEILPVELYHQCGNSQWSAAVKHTGFGGTEYTLTLLPEGTLLLRNYWEMEGARMVAHGWYRRMDPEE